MSDILVLNGEVFAYGSSTTSCSRVLIINDFEVLILSFLRKGDSIGLGIDNSFIKLEIVVSGKAFTLLS